MSAPARSRQKAAPTVATEQAGDVTLGEVVEGMAAVGDGAVQQPGDIITEAAVGEAHNGKELQVVAAGYGVLTLDPGQRRLNDDQRAALLAINIDTATDPLITPHILPFIHLCQTRGLDPWAKEAYLIGRGKGNYRKFTMQVAIDGYLKLAKRTGQYRGIKRTLWTGQDDDMQRSWFLSDGVMERLWWSQWPAGRGEPGSARAIIDHYDDQLDVVTTEGIADWGMYAPYSPKYEGTGDRRRKVVDDKGQPVMELTEMWGKGGAHMLAKCAIALGLRRAFPAAMSGMYLHEEMHQADAAEQRRLAEERRELRRAKVIDLRGQRVPTPAEEDPAPAVEAPVVEAEDADGVESVLASPSAPMPLGDILNTAMAKGSPDPGRAEPAPAPDGNPGQRQGWLVAELDHMAEVTGSTRNALARRWIAQHRKNVEDATDAELLPLVASLRPMVIAKMRGDDDVARADYYAQVPEDECGPVQWLLGASLAAPK